jgi:hypothetical protein
VLRHPAGQGHRHRAALTQDPTLRQEAVRKPLRTLTNGEPQFILHPRCKVLRKGFMGGYHRRRMQTGRPRALLRQAEKNSLLPPARRPAVRHGHKAGIQIPDTRGERRMPRAPDDRPKRRAMTLARKTRIHTKQFGMCGCNCGHPVDLSGPGVRYDHTISFWLRPDLDDDGPNVKAVRVECDAPKTYGHDIPQIAKTKRQSKMRLDTPREASKRPIRSRGFDPAQRKMQSRPFPKRRKP